MQNWNISGLILEGISGTGKTTHLKNIINSKIYKNKKYDSSIILTEHQTQRVLEKKQRDKTLIKEDNIKLLNNHVNYLEALKTNLDNMEWCRKGSTNMRIPYILERFHLTHCNQYNHIHWKDVEAIDNRLVELDAKLCLFTTNKEELGKRLFTGRDNQWRNYLKRFGNSEKEIVNHFFNQQNELLEISERSKLEKIIIDTSNSTPDNNIYKIFDLWGITK